MANAINFLEINSNYEITSTALINTLNFLELDSNYSIKTAVLKNISTGSRSNIEKIKSNIKTGFSNIE